MARENMTRTSLNRATSISHPKKNGSDEKVQEAREPL
jgi:hypothetical protein